jgi:hypothetical protein
MTLMQLIKLVLDEAYDEMPYTEDSDKDEKVKEQLNLLGPKYKNLTVGPHDPIDYSDPVARFAYIYKYTVAHADYIMQLIQGTQVLRDLFDRDSLDVACLGGGPGSDLLGILKYMIKRDKKCPLRCFLFDKERAWGDSWGDVAKPLDASFRVYPIFQQLDVTDSKTWAGYHKYLKADLFTLSYFMSEVWKIRAQAKPFFDYCFAKAKPGALLLFLDNRASEFYGWFDSLAAANGIEIVKGNATLMCFANEEEKKDLGRYYEKFGFPKRKSEVSFRIGRKK